MITECLAGPLTVASQSTASCTPGSTDSGSPNYVVTTCTDNQIQPPTATAGCTPGTAGDNTRTLCSYPAGPNNAVVVGAASCANVTNPSSPYVYVTCTYPAGPNNATTYPNSCTVGSTTDGSNTTSVCSQPAGTNYTNTQVPTCTAGTLANNQQITCFRA